MLLFSLNHKSGYFIFFPIKVSGTMSVENPIREDHS